MAKKLGFILLVVMLTTVLGLALTASSAPSQKPDCQDCKSQCNQPPVNPDQKVVGKPRILPNAKLIFVKVNSIKDGIIRGIVVEPPQGPKFDKPLAAVDNLLNPDDVEKLSGQGELSFILPTPQKLGPPFNPPHPGFMPQCQPGQQPGPMMRQRAGKCEGDCNCNCNCDQDGKNTRRGPKSSNCNGMNNCCDKEQGCQRYCQNNCQNNCSDCKGGNCAQGCNQPRASEEPRNQSVFLYDVYKKPVVTNNPDCCNNKCQMPAQPKRQFVINCPTCSIEHPGDKLTPPPPPAPIVCPHCGKPIPMPMPMPMPPCDDQRQPCMRGDQCENPNQPMGKKEFNQQRFNKQLLPPHFPAFREPQPGEVVALLIPESDINLALEGRSKELKVLMPMAGHLMKNKEPKGLCFENKMK